MITAGSDAGLTYTYWKDTTAATALTDAEATAAVSGTYYIKATNQSGCFAIKPVVVNISSAAAGTITPAGDTTVCNRQTLTLTASNGTSYQWFRDDNIINGATSATYDVTQEGDYHVVINNGTCTGRTPVVVVSFRECPSTAEVFVPTAFTPNRNNANDDLRPYFKNVQQLVSFKVFNRWGQLVFQTNTMDRGWYGLLKGVPQHTETYTWILE